MSVLKDLMLHCNRCGHGWLRRTVKLPAQCPKCKTTFWNKPRVRKIARDRRAAKRN